MGKLFLSTMLIILITLGLMSCTSEEATDNVAELATLQMTWVEMDAAYKKANINYTANKAFFNTEQQQTIDDGMVAIDKARNRLKAIKDAEKVTDKGKAVGKFLLAYSDARTGYILIRQVMLDKQDVMSTENKKSFLDFDRLALAMDNSVKTLKGTSETSEKVNQLIGLVGNLSLLFGNATAQPD